jgi:hypothetical protein
MAVIACIGDCNSDGVVTVDELLTGINMALGRASTCSAFGFPEDSSVTISNILRAVNNALDGCKTGPPSFSLSVHVARNADTQVLQAVADLTNSGGVPVSYLLGCSALCRPKFYQAISFRVIGPQGTEVIAEEPCGSVALCPEYPQVFAPGESTKQALDITGTEWLWDTTSTIFECGTCTPKILQAGRYRVIARFQYSTDLNNPWPFPDYVEASSEFDWP